MPSFSTSSISLLTAPRLHPSRIKHHNLPTQLGEDPEIITTLIEHLRTGDLKAFDRFNLLWLKNSGAVDLMDGFIEVYNDPLGRKGSYQGGVALKDDEATLRTKKLVDNAQWFEDHLPINPEYKKKEAKGATGLVVNEVIMVGDWEGPFLGQNLPNSEWIRENYGYKAATLANIAAARDLAFQQGPALEEFFLFPKLIDSYKKYGLNNYFVTTDLHEITGHGSGRIKEGVQNPSETLGAYGSLIEEVRAESVSLYYVMDQKLVELKILPDLEAGKLEYENFMNNGLLRQLAKLELGQNISYTYMRMRYLMASWIYEQGQKENVVEKKVKDGKTYFVVNDYEKMRGLVAQLLAETQRIKSEGDFEAAKALVEGYAVKSDPALHKEVLERWSKLNIASESALLHPKLVPVMKGDQIVDVKIEYPMDFAAQRMEYAEKYSFLPTYN